VRKELSDFTAAVYLKKDVTARNLTARKNIVSATIVE
jgi:hypothetical protein